MVIEVAGVTAEVLCRYPKNELLFQNYLTDKPPVLKIAPTEADLHNLQGIRDKWAEQQGYLMILHEQHALVYDDLEWNVKVTAKDLPATIRKIAATFDTYWHSDEFEFYGPDMRPRLVEALRAEHCDREHPQFLFDIRPYPYQQEILDKLLAEREVRGSFRNLIRAEGLLQLS